MVSLVKTFLTLILMAVIFVPAVAAAKESAYDRVMRTGTLRCGFNYIDSIISKDDRTGSMTGLAAELTNKIAEVGGLKVEWVGPLDWGNIRVELESGKIDAMCAAMWQSGQKAKYMIFSAPFSYQGLEAYIRADDNRFSGDVRKINDSKMTVVIIDNDNSDFIARTDFPKAKRFPLPQTAADADVFLPVVTGKADVAFAVTGLANQFIKHNPGKLKPLADGHYLRIFGNTYVVGANEFQLNHFIETTLAEIENSGYVDELIDRYNKQYPKMFIKKAKSYKTEGR